MTRRPGTRPTVRTLAGAVVGALVLAILTITPAAAAAEPLPNGLSAPTAAGSCWEIKQNTPTAGSGVYWLVTPALVNPQQFYCDQVTDGGGWAMVGRGREGWKGYYNGLGTPDAISGTPSGVSAFKTAQLPALTVDGLLNKGRVDALADGIRVRRATDVAGTAAYQEVRVKLAKRDRWVWTFDGEQPIKTYSFGTTLGNGGITANFGTNTAFNRVNTVALSTHGYRAGWTYGPGVTGQSAATSYLWTPANGQASAMPFAQMFVRPKLLLATMDFGTVPDEGAPATKLSAIPQTDAQRTTWGVSGFANGQGGELNTEVAAFGEAAGKVYVGGNFRYVQRTEIGGDQVEQPYVAAFDVNTSEWVPGFRPALNGQVKAINALPDGRLAVAGQFTTVNGQSQAALAFLDPATGALSGPQVALENRGMGAVPFARDLDVQGNFLYVAGAFTHLTKVGSTTSATTWNGGRINLATSDPDPNWNAFLNGTTAAVDASDRGDRAYYAGYFKTKNTTSSPSAAALQTTAGAPLTTPKWTPTFSKSGTDANGNITGNVWQLAVIESGDQVWLGGSEHSFFSYNRDTFVRTSGNITKNGGDFQNATAGNGLIFAGCHCGDFVYQDAYTWSDVGTNWTQGDKMNLFGAWDAQTHRYVAEFSPIVEARVGYGVWALFVDSRGVVWAGGDLLRSVRSGWNAQWSGGYARYAPRDTAPPTTPGSPAVTSIENGTKARLDWTASTDTGGGVTYEVLRGNRVIDSTTFTTYTVPAGDTATKYFVRARDDAGNRSASSAALTVAPVPTTALTFIQERSTYSWRFSADALPSDWASPAFNDSAWSVGAAPLGRGFTGAATNIDPTNLSPRPLSGQFRKKFSVTEASSVINGKVTVIANDGVVVYLNGVELGRSRMPSGALTQNSYATAVVTHAAASASRATFDVPQGLLVEGTNVMAASMHGNSRTSADASFDLSFTGERGAKPVPPDAVTDLVAQETTFNSAKLAWTAPTGPGVATSYVIKRDGQEIGTVPASQTTYADSGLTAEQTYLYSVTAKGLGGSSPESTLSVTTPKEPGPETKPVVIANGAQWSWLYSSQPLPADWASPTFDDSAWATGAGTLARGVSGAATNIDPSNLATKPLSAQFRKNFAVASPSTLQDGTLTVIANDGVVVYINGTEIGRSRMPAGAITQNTYATSAVSHSTAAANRVTFAVPASVLVDGNNVISASVHANYRSTPDLSFDLALSMPR